MYLDALQLFAIIIYLMDEFYANLIIELPLKLRKCLIIEAYTTVFIKYKQLTIKSIYYCIVYISENN